MSPVSFIAATADPSEGTASHPDHPSTSPSEQVIGLARAAAVEVAGGGKAVGDYLSATPEDEVAVSLAFAAEDRGYRGWYWSVTVALVDDTAPTISEVVLLPGGEALLAPPWVPWDQRIRAGDVGAGDLLATPPDDPRLVPGYLDSDDPAVAEVSYEFGFGRIRVLGREGREDAAQRWHDGPFGPDSPIAAAAPATCGSCGFYVPLAGLLGMATGACSNEFSPADGRVVDVEFGCGAHSETVIEAPMISAATDTVVDELTLEVHTRPVPADQDDVVEVAAAEFAAPELDVVEIAEVEISEVEIAEVEVEVAEVQVEIAEVEVESAEAEITEVDDPENEVAVVEDAVVEDAEVEIVAAPDTVEAESDAADSVPDSDATP